MSGSQVAIDLGRIERNARTIVERCAVSGIKVFGVTKGTCGMPQVARAMLRGGVAGIAESRFENIRRLRDSGIAAPVMLLRSAPIARVEEVVRTVDISLLSELAIISRIAERMGRGWAAGSGGITVHEAHQAMETIALSGGLLSMDVSGLTAELEPRLATETINFVMSAFGKRIL